MIFDQSRDFTDRIVVKFQPAKNAFCHFFASGACILNDHAHFHRSFASLASQYHEVASSAEGLCPAAPEADREEYVLLLYNNDAAYSVQSPYMHQTPVEILW